MLEKNNMQMYLFLIQLLWLRNITEKSVNERKNKNGSKSMPFKSDLTAI